MCIQNIFPRIEINIPLYLLQGWYKTPETLDDLKCYVLYLSFRDSDEPTGMMSSLSTSATPLITMATDMNVLDMPVDPNEPTYCLCHQVRSFPTNLSD